MMGEVEDNHETRGVNASKGYLQRTLQATSTIWLSLVVVVIAAFGLSESLRVARGEGGADLLIAFIAGPGLILLALWRLPRPVFTLKEGIQNRAKQGKNRRTLPS